MMHFEENSSGVIDFRTISISDVIECMHDFDPSLKHRLPTIWTRSAFISTVDSISTEIVKNYIENQKTN